MLLLAAVLSVLWAPHLGSGAPSDPLCSVVMTYDEINSAAPHWSASFQVQTRLALPPGSTFDVKLAGSNDSTTLPHIVAITVNGRDICPTHKVLTTITNFSTKMGADVSDGAVEAVTTMDDSQRVPATTDILLETTTDQPMSTVPAPSTL